MELSQIYQRIESRMEAMDLSSRAASLRADLSPDAIRNIARALRSGDLKRGVNTGTIAALAEALDVTPEWLLTGRGVEKVESVKLVGRVGAGSAIDLTNADETGETVEAPPNATQETVAVQVSGDSMHPAYDDGEVLYYSANMHPTELVNRKCVVKLASGGIYVKLLRPGVDGLWNLESLNPLYPTMTDQAVEWAAKIDWVKPR